MIDREFTALRDAAVGSLAGRTVQATAGIVCASTRTSIIGRSIQSAVAAWRGMDQGERTKLLLLTLGSATIFYAVLLSIEPPYVASGIPKPWFYGVGLALIAASTAGSSFAAAMSGSAIGRFSRWLIG